MSWQGFFTALERISSASELAQRVTGCKELQGCSICMQTSGAADGWLLLLNCASFPEELRLSKCNNLSFLSQDCSQTTAKSGKSTDKTSSLHLGYCIWIFCEFCDIAKEKFKYLGGTKIGGKCRKKISPI